jgi:hypothetical protein
MRILFVLVLLLVLGTTKLPIERQLAIEHQDLGFRRIELGLGLREQIGQLGFVAALSGFRSLVADMLFIRAHIAWERTEWSRVSLHFQQITTLQPRAVLFWEMAAWHMAWNASAAALRDPAQPRLTLRVKAEREFIALGRDFLERGVRNNPDSPQLYEALGRLYRDKYRNHERASALFEKTAKLPGAPSYAKRFAAYELSYCEGREREAYEKLHQLYLAGEKERVPTLLTRLKFLEEKLNIPAEQRIPGSR